MNNPAGGNDTASHVNPSPVDYEKYPLSEYEKDALGEIGNICMGTSATTLSSLLGKQVSITTPQVSLTSNLAEVGPYKKPYVAVEVSYTSGIDGYNILLIKNEDVLVITDLLMGGTGEVDPDSEIGELQLSAISEVMNQMIGSSSTSLSNIIKMPVNIAPPHASKITLEEDSLDCLVCGHDTIIVISFAMQIQDVLNSNIMQIMPFQFGKKLASVLLKEMNEASEAAAPAQGYVSAQQVAQNPVQAEVPQPVAAQQAPIPEQAPAPPPVQAPAYQQPVPAAAVPQQPYPAQYAPSPPGYAPPPYPPQYAPQYPPQRAPEQNRVSVKAMQYQSFDDPYQDGRNPYDRADLGDSLGLILDVPLQVTVELGQCKKSIKDILSLSMGSVVVLNRMAGEMVDIMVNGKLFARGEVVVIDDNYGVRVTEIIASPGGSKAATLFDSL